MTNTRGEKTRGLVSLRTFSLFVLSCLPRLTSDLWPDSPFLPCRASGSTMTTPSRGEENVQKESFTHRQSFTRYGNTDRRKMWSEASKKQTHPQVPQSRPGPQSLVSPCRPRPGAARSSHIRIILGQRCDSIPNELAGCVFKQ